MNAAVSRLNELLKKTPVVEAKKDQPEVEVRDDTPEVPKEFDAFIKTLNKEFGKDNILSTEANSQMLKVAMTSSAYVANQAKFEAKGREAWLSDNGMAILSVMPDVEPASTKIYFCRIQTLNAPE